MNYRLTLQKLAEEQDTVQSAKTSPQVLGLERERANVKRRLQKTLDTIYHVDYAKSGVASGDMLMKWLESMAEFEAAKAEIEMLNQRRIDFDSLYNVLAPMGANMKKLERKIGIEEKRISKLTFQSRIGQVETTKRRVAIQLENYRTSFLPR